MKHLDSLLNNKKKRKFIYIFLYIILSCFVVILFFNPFKKFVNLSEYNVLLLSSSRIYYSEGDFLTDSSAEILSAASYSNTVDFSLFRKSNMSCITEIPSEYILRQISGMKFYNEDVDLDGINELFFGYIRNDSLFLCEFSPQRDSLESGYFSEYFLCKSKSSKSITNKKNATSINDLIFSDCLGDSVKEIIISIATSWGKPRTTAIFDYKSKKIAAKLSFPSISGNVKFYDDRFYICYYAPFNGIYEEGRKDTFSAFIVTDTLLKPIAETDFPLYSGLFMMIDTLKKEIGVVIYSNWNMEENPTKYLKFKLNDNQLINEKVLCEGFPSATSVFSKDFCFTVMDTKNSKIVLYDRKGNEFKKFPLTEKFKSMDYPKQMFSKELGCNIIVFTEGTNSKIFTEKGKHLADISGRLIDFYGEYMRFSIYGESGEYNIVKLSKNNNYRILSIFLIVVLITISHILAFLVKYSSKYFFMLNLWNLYSKASPEAVFILFKGRVVASNQFSIFYSNFLNRYDLKILHQKQEIVQWDGKNIEVKIIPFKVFFLTFTGITLHDITSEIMNENYKMLLNATSLIAHDIKNALTSVKATRQMMELKGKKFDDETKEFLEKLEQRNKGILLSCDNIMQLVYRNVTKRDVQLNLLIKEIAERFGKTVAVKIEEKNINLETEPNLLKYAIVNFLENAVYAVTFEKSGEVIITAKQQSGKIQIEIINTTPFLDEETISKIKEGGYTTKKSGNGLGFMISKLVIETLGGKVDMFSTKETGVTVRISL